MAQSLQLGTAGNTDEQQTMRRLNRLPIIVAIVIIVLFFGVVIVGLSWRGLSFNSGNELDTTSKTPATTFGDQLKRGVTDGIIGEPEQREVFQPTPVIVDREPVRDPVVERRNEIRTERRSQLEPEAEWKARLKREQDEQVIRETQRQRMASLQARATALDSPLKVDVSEIQKNASESRTDTRQPLNATTNSASDLYAAAMKSGLLGQNVDQNGQTSKEDFFNQDIKDLGYLPNQVVPQLSPYELKRGSVIPATMITGLN